MADARTEGSVAWAEEECGGMQTDLPCGAFLIGHGKDWGLFLNCNKVTLCVCVCFTKCPLAAVCVEKAFPGPERMQRNRY